MTERYRTWLHAPGDRPYRCLKALVSGADQAIWDLEDAVYVAAKVTARKLVAELLCGNLPRVPWVRINGLDTAWGEDDFKSLVGIFANRVPRFVIPKATVAIAQKVADFGVDGERLYIVETASGVADLMNAVRPWPSLGSARLAFGALDYRNDIRALETPDESELLFARSLLVVTSRQWGWPAPIDSAFPNISQGVGLKGSTQRGRALGMGGKMIIHPDQIRSVHEVYAPTAEELSRAERVLAATSSKGVVQVDGIMVDRPIIEQARQVLDQKQTPNA